MVQTFSFASVHHLEDRLLADPKRVVYLVGAAICAPVRAGEPGVPGVDGVIDEIKRLYTNPGEQGRLQAALAADNPYQAAFAHVHATRGPDAANAVIRRCVLRARRPSTLFPHVHSDVPAHEMEALCRQLEADIEGWHLPAAVKALGTILAWQAKTTRSVVLTSNFDPLITVSVRLAGGEVHTTAFHSDGGFTGVDGPGTMVVHFNGDWFRSDTLHTRFQLGQARPRLAASLGQLLGSRTLVVLGHSGRDDIFVHSLGELVAGSVAPIDVCWALHGDDDAQLTAEHAHLLARLGPGIARGRVNFYKAVDVHLLLPRLARATRHAFPTIPTPPPSEETGRSFAPQDVRSPDVCTLYIQSVGAAGEMRSFVQDTIKIGREFGDIVLPDNQVSRMHGEICRDGPILRYSDLGSTNGTYLRDGRRVSDIELVPGTVLCVGLSWITVVQTPQPGRPEPAEIGGPVRVRAAKPAIVGCYAQRDERSVRALLVHLRTLEHASTIEFLTDSPLATRETWREGVEFAIRKASVVLLIVSAEFLASEFFESREIVRTLIKAQRDGALVVPLIVGHCMSHSDPTLAKFQPFNPHGAPLATLNKKQQDREFVRLVTVLGQHVQATRPGER